MYKESIKAWKPSEDKLQAEKKSVLEKIALIAAGKKKNDGSEDSSDVELRRIEAELAKKPKQIVISTNDATVEKLAELEAVNRNGIALKRDEIAGLLEKLEGSDTRGDRAFYIVGFEGGDRYRVDRLTREASTIPSHTISIGGTTQPGPLKALIKTSSGLSKKNDGLPQRFSLFVAQLKPKSPCYVDMLVDPTEVDKLHSANSKVRRWAQEAIDYNDDGYIIARFSESAQKEFVRVFEDLQRRVHSYDYHPDLQAHLGKFPKLIPSLALVFTLIQSAYSGDAKPPSEIPIDSLLLAERWAMMLELHAEWLYDAHENSVSAPARALAEKIQSGLIVDGQGLPKIYRRGWSHLKSEEMLSAAVEELAQHGWCYTEHKRGAKGAPAIVIRLHPSFADVTEDRQK